METVKEGQIFKFHTSLADENSNQLYVVLEAIEDNEKSRVKIQALNTVKLTDLELAEVDNNDLIGHKVTINKSDFSQVQGRVIKVSEQKTELNLSVAAGGVETNVLVTVVDNDGIEHLGTLFINQE